MAPEEGSLVRIADVAFAAQLREARRLLRVLPALSRPKTRAALENFLRTKLKRSLAHAFVVAPNTVVKELAHQDLLTFEAVAAITKAVEALDSQRCMMQSIKDPVQVAKYMSFIRKIHGSEIEGTFEEVSGLILNRDSVIAGSQSEQDTALARIVQRFRVVKSSLCPAGRSLTPYRLQAVNEADEAKPTDEAQATPSMKFPAMPAAMWILSQSFVQAKTSLPALVDALCGVGDIVAGAESQGKLSYCQLRNAGDVVNVNWGGHGHWLEGKVEVAHTDGSCDVLCKAFRIDKVKTQRLRPLPAHNRVWAVGDHVAANWNGKGTWWSAYVTAVCNDDHWDLMYEEITFWQEELSESRVRRPTNTREEVSREPAASRQGAGREHKKVDSRGRHWHQLDVDIQAKRSTFLAGEHVEGQSHRRGWSSGYIEEVNDDGSLIITFEVKSTWTEDRVSANNIRSALHFTEDAKVEVRLNESSFFSGESLWWRGTICKINENGTCSVTLSSATSEREPGEHVEVPERLRAAVVVPMSSNESEIANEILKPRLPAATPSALARAARIHREAQLAQGRGVHQRGRRAQHQASRGPTGIGDMLKEQQWEEELHDITKYDEEDEVGNAVTRKELDPKAAKGRVGKAVHHDPDQRPKHHPKNHKHAGYARAKEHERHETVQLQKEQARDKRMRGQARSSARDRKIALARVDSRNF